MKPETKIRKLLAPLFIERVETANEIHSVILSTYIGAEKYGIRISILDYQLRSNSMMETIKNEISYSFKRSIIEQFLSNTITFSDKTKYLPTSLVDEGVSIMLIHPKEYINILPNKLAQNHVINYQVKKK